MVVFFLLCRSKEKMSPLRKPYPPCPFRIHVDKQFEDAIDRVRRVIRSLDIRDENGKRYKVSAMLTQPGAGQQAYHDKGKIRKLLMRAEGEELFYELCGYPTYQNADESRYAKRVARKSAKSWGIAKKKRFTPYKWDKGRLADDLMKAIRDSV